MTRLKTQRGTLGKSAVLTEPDYISICISLQVAPVRIVHRVYVWSPDWPGDGAGDGRSRCKTVNWLFTLGFPVQTNTDRSFLVVFEVVYVV